MTTATPTAAPAAGTRHLANKYHLLVSLHEDMLMLLKVFLIFSY